MIASEIITKFRLQVDDQTELSSDEELDLLNDVYLETVFERPWNILKTSVSGTIVNNEITLPSNFAYLYANRNWAGIGEESQLPVIFIGDNYQPVYIINFDQRRQYRTSSNYAYLDYANNKIVFTMTPQFSTYEFDYIKVPERLGLNDTPVFPERFHNKFVFDMAIKDSIIQMSDKAADLVASNRAESLRYKSAMDMWDSRLTII